MTWAIFFKGFFAAALLGISCLVALWLRRFIPDGRVRDFLYRERTRNPTTRDKVLMASAVFIGYCIIFGAIIYLGGLT